MRLSCEAFYRYTYSLLEEVTPLPADCGQLCGAACCKGDDETGMYLFPGERVMYRVMPSWMEVAQSAFSYLPGRFTDLALCTPWCDRGLRPLACRIFPLLPYIREEGGMEVVMDPRGRAMCPLARVIRKRELDGEFVRRVEYLAALMYKIEPLRTFLEELSRLIDQATTLG